MTMDPKTDTLFGGRTVAAQLLTGETIEVRVRQFPLGDYERAFALFEDEIALTAFCCCPTSPAGPTSPASQTKEWAHTLTPESYEALHAAVEEVNAKGFFAWSARRKSREAALQQSMIAAMASLPPDALKLAIEAGARNTLPNLSPTPPRRPG